MVHLAVGAILSPLVQFCRAQMLHQARFQLDFCLSLLWLL